MQKGKDGNQNFSDCNQWLPECRRRGGEEWGEKKNILICQDCSE